MQEPVWRTEKRTMLPGRVDLGAIERVLKVLVDNHFTYTIATEEYSNVQFEQLVDLYSAKKGPSASSRSRVLRRT